MKYSIDFDQTAKHSSLFDQSLHCIDEKTSYAVSPMTVCIAAIAENGKKLVVASDKMVTNTPGGVTYQSESPDVQKIYYLPNDSVILIAGSSSDAMELIRNVKKTLVEKDVKDPDAVAAVIEYEFKKYRWYCIGNYVLAKRGLDWGEYYSKQSQLNSQIAQLIDKEITEWTLNVELIFAGKDAEGLYRIYYICSPGHTIPLNAAGYLCIGNGSPHAQYYLIGSGYKKDMSAKDVEKLVLEAKKKSEAAPGVGRETVNKILPSAASEMKEKVTANKVRDSMAATKEQPRELEEKIEEKQR